MTTALIATTALITTTAPVATTALYANVARRAVSGVWVGVAVTPAVRFAVHYRKA
jgi:hypothetical protein